MTIDKRLDATGHPRRIFQWEQHQTLHHCGGPNETHLSPSPALPFRTLVDIEPPSHFVGVKRSLLVGPLLLLQLDT
jgi:hypothetical protein